MMNDPRSSSSRPATTPAQRWQSAVDLQQRQNRAALLGGASPSSSSSTTAAATRMVSASAENSPMKNQPSASVSFLSSSIAANNSNAFDQPLNNSLPEVASGLGQVEGMYQTMAEMEKKKNAEIGALRAEVEQLRAKTARQEEELTMVLAAIEEETQHRDASAVTEVKERKRAVFATWRFKLERRRNRKAVDLLNQLALVADAAVTKHSAVTQTRPQELGKALANLADAEEALVCSRQDMIDMLLSEVSGEVVANLGEPRWSALLSNVSARYDRVASCRVDAIAKAQQNDVETAQLAADCVAALATIGGELAKILPNGSQRQIELGSLASKLLHFSVPPSQPPLSVSGPSGALDIINDAALGYIQFVSSAPLFTALDQQQQQQSTGASSSSTQTTSGEDSTSTLALAAARNLETLENHMLSLPLSLQVRDAYRALLKQNNTGPSLGALGGGFSNNNMKEDKPTIEVTMTQIVPDLDALLESSSRPPTMSMSNATGLTAISKNHIGDDVSFSARYVDHHSLIAGASPIAASPSPSVVHVNATPHMRLPQSHDNVNSRTFGTPRASLLGAGGGTAPTTPRLGTQNTNTPNTSLKEQIMSIRKRAAQDGNGSSILS